MRIDFEGALDPDQYRAVVATEGPSLIIAGAGSGKTRVITYRIARLLSLGVPQESILALTFTNKAAKEMAQRTKELVGAPLANLMVSTFHSFGAWFLRREIHRIGYRPNFSIYDEEDKARILRECLRELGIPLENVDVAALAVAVSLESGGRGGSETALPEIGRIRDEYRKSLLIYNAVDFDDLISLPLRILKEFPEARDAARSRFRYVLVDEFQDTSLQQYELLRLISDGNVCAVGDDDQSIYSWRGANFGNIGMFEKDNPGLVEIKLERNYRSTSKILEAANAVISHNVKRKEKALWAPSGVSGLPLKLEKADDEIDEARRIVSTMKKLRIQGEASWEGFGILVRTNAQARAIEETLLEEGIPVRTSGGPSFYQRREVRDMLAYLRVAANPDDDASMSRILNVPRRGIGKAGLEKISGWARPRSRSIFSSLEELERLQDPLLRHRPVAEAVEFATYIKSLRGSLLAGSVSISARLRQMVEEIGYWQYLLEEHRSEEKVAAWKYRNVELLAASIERWERDPDIMDKGLFAYLARVSLVTRDDPEDTEGKVSLLTIHAAKGLEFDTVFLPGLEEGVLPHARSVEENSGDIEEERRLFYVALTRARKRLFLSLCLARGSGTRSTPCIPSSFLKELPPALLDSAGSGEAEVSEDELKARAFARLKERFVPKG